MSDDASTRFSLLELDEFRTYPKRVTAQEDDGASVRFSLLELDIPGWSPPTAVPEYVGESAQEPPDRPVMRATPPAATPGGFDLPAPLAAALGVEVARTPPVEVRTWKPQRAGESRTLRLERTRDVDGRYGRYSEGVYSDREGRHWAVASAMLLSLFRYATAGAFLQVTYRGMTTVMRGRKECTMHDWAAQPA